MLRCARGHAQKNRRARARRSFSPGLGKVSLDLEVLGGFLAAARHDLVCDDLPLIESAQSCALDRRNMDEHVLAAALGLNEPIAFGRIEPLHSAFRHSRLLLTPLPYRSGGRVPMAPKAPR